MKLPIIYSITEIPEGVFIRYIPASNQENAQAIFEKSGYTKGWIYRTQKKTWRLIIGKEEYDYVNSK